MAEGRGRRAGHAAVVVAAVALLLGCVPEGGDPTPSAATTATTSPSPIATRHLEPSPTATAAQIPTDCRGMLTDAVLAQLDDLPLNDPAFGPSGVQGDGSLVCIWGDPAADATGLTTSIQRVARGAALDLLNELADDEGFTCYTPDGGTRCEKTWQNETSSAPQGRTLFWRDDILIDTRYSDLAPPGYTAAIVAAVYG